MLWIVPKPPLPERDGATRVSGALLRALSEHEALGSIEILAVRREGALLPLMPLHEASLYTFRPRNRLLSLLLSPSRMCRDVPSFVRYDSVALRARAESLGHRVWLFDGLHASAPWWDGKRYNFPDNVLILYRSHNIETEIVEEKLKRVCGFKHALWRLELRRVSKAESALHERADHVFSISSRDSMQAEARYQNQAISVLPVPYLFHEAVDGRRSDQDAPFLFLGRLDWSPNKEGLLWFLRYVWPEVVKKCPHYRLVIAGIGDGSYLQPYTQLTGVELLGEVRSVEELYRTARAAIIPIFQGSGVRVKALEAIAHGVPLLTTQKGCEGIDCMPARDAVFAEHAIDWIRAMIDWDDNHAQQRAIDLAKRLGPYHNPKKHATHLVTVIKNMNAADDKNF